MPACGVSPLLPVGGWLVPIRRGERGGFARAALGDQFRLFRLVMSSRLALRAASSS